MISDFFIDDVIFSSPAKTRGADGGYTTSYTDKTAVKGRLTTVSGSAVNSQGKTIVVYRDVVYCTVPSFTVAENFIIKYDSKIYMIQFIKKSYNEFKTDKGFLIIDVVEKKA